MRNTDRDRFNAHTEKIREFIASASDHASLIEAPYAVADLEAYAVGTQALASHAHDVRQRAHDVRQRLLAEYEPDTDRDRFDKHMESITAHMNSIRDDFDDYGAEMTGLLDHLEGAIDQLEAWASSHADAATTAASIVDAKLADIADAERPDIIRPQELSELANVVAEMLTSLADS